MKRYIRNTSVLIQEHSIKMQGNKFYTPITCIKGMYPDSPLCCQELGLKDGYLAGYLTIINCTPVKDPKDPKSAKYAYELQFLQCKLSTLKLLRQTKDMKGSLANMIWKASRTGDKSPRCGNVFMFDKDVKDMKKLYESVSYRGEKISKLFENANAGGPEAIEKIKRTFSVVINSETGKIEPIIPAFNYAELLKPQEPRNMRDILMTRVKEDRFGGLDTGGFQTSGVSGADF